MFLSFVVSPVFMIKLELCVKFEFANPERTPYLSHVQK